jgi:hypothetical protein
VVKVAAPILWPRMNEIEPAEVRELWRTTEPYHAVAYFAPEVVEAEARLGLKGFWMGYFSGRAAPMGAVGPAVVVATFFNFAPWMVERALPDAWQLASPAAVVASRFDGVDQALRGLLGPLVGSEELRTAAALARAAADACATEGRPLAAAWAGVAPPDDPHLALWLALSVLREHRGDGHVAALVEDGLDGCEVHPLLVAEGGSTRAMQQRARGWDDEQWEAAVDRLVERGWLDQEGKLTELARGRREVIEAATDRLATAPWAALGRTRLDHFAQAMSPLHAAIAAHALIPYPNPMGLTAPTTS